RRRGGTAPAPHRAARGRRAAARPRPRAQRRDHGLHPAMIPIFPPHGLDQTIHVAVLVGVWVLLFFTESFGWVWSGLVGPCYLASVFVIQPAAGATIVFESVLTFLVARLLSAGISATGAWSRFVGRGRFLVTVVVSAVA